MKKITEKKPIDIEAFCIAYGWNPTMLSRKAGINYRTALKAYNREPVDPKIRIEIAKAFSAQAGEEIQPGDLDMNVIDRSRKKFRVMQPVA